MNRYAIRRRDDGKYVAPPGQEHSYTRDLTRAQHFDTRESAERSRCENESVVDVETLLPPGALMTPYPPSYHAALNRLIIYGAGDPDPNPSRTRSLIARALVEIRHTRGRASAQHERRHMFYVQPFPDKV